MIDWLLVYKISTKARLLREKDLSLDKALDMCKSSEITSKLDCILTVVFFANTSDGKRRCVHIRTKGLERV